MQAQKFIVSNELISSMDSPDEFYRQYTGNYERELKRGPYYEQLAKLPYKTFFVESDTCALFVEHGNFKLDHAWKKEWERKLREKPPNLKEFSPSVLNTRITMIDSHGHISPFHILINGDTVELTDEGRVLYNTQESLKAAENYSSEYMRRKGIDISFFHKGETDKEKAAFFEKFATDVVMEKHNAYRSIVYMLYEILLYINVKNKVIVPYKMTKKEAIGVPKKHVTVLRIPRS